MPNTTNNKNPATSENHRGIGSLKTFRAVLKNVDNSKSIDISSLIVDVSIYEDIFSKTLYGEAAIKDSVNLLNGIQLSENPNDSFPIVGEEYLEIRYSLFDDTPEVFRRFFVYSVKNISIDENLKSRNYVLNFCSEEHLIDSTTLVQKSYRDNIGNIVQDILENYLMVNEETENGKRKKIYQIQQTRGQQQLVIPKLSPLETLDLLARRSIADKLFTSASYLFFENKDGFNFCDIEYLIQRGKEKILKEQEDNRVNSTFSSIYRYYYQNPTNSSGNVPGQRSIHPGKGHDDEGSAYKTIISMNQLHKFDTIEKLRNGYFESDVIVYDLINRSVTPNIFQFLDKYKDSNTLGSTNTGTTFPENSLDFIRSVTQSPSAPPKIFGIFSIANGEVDPVSGKHTKVFFIPNNTDSKHKTYLEEIYPNRASYMSRLVQNMFSIEVYGDTEIGAGDVITIDLPEIDGFTSGSKFDKYMSGYFLVTSIHHKLTSDSYHCTYDIFKNGFSQGVINSELGDQVAANPFINIELDPPITNAKGI
jgi:hypothetical protein